MTAQRQDARTRAALGIDGRGFFPWQLRGIRAISTALVKQVWQGPTDFPVLPAVGAGLTAVSDAATDTAPGGAGARSIAVVYLNSKFEIRLGLANLNGLGVVDVLKFDQVKQETTTSVLDAIRVVAVNITAVGVTGNNDGIVDVSIGADLQARIPRTAAIVSLVMLNSARPGGFTVPSGYCALVDSFSNDLGQGSVKVVLQARPPRQPFQGVLGGGHGYDAQNRDPLTFPAATDLRIVYQATGIIPSGLFAEPEISLYLHPDDLTQDTDPLQIPRLDRCGFGV